MASSSTPVTKARVRLGGGHASAVGAMRRANVQDRVMRRKERRYANAFVSSQLKEKSTLL